MADGSASDAGGALEGVLIVELTETLAGEIAGGVLADLGATVVKIEPPAGSPMRARGTAIPGEDSLYFQSENRGKRSVVAQLAVLRDQPWFRALIEAAAGVVEDLGPGALEAFGLAPDELQRVNPRLSILRLSPFGQTGPLSGAPGDDRTAQAFSSAQFVTGFVDRPPHPITVPMADGWAGVHGASGLLGAILSARRTKAGDVVDLALYETMLRTQGSSIINFDRTGQVTSRQGNFAQGVVPGNVFETKDGGFVALSGAGEKPFARLCEAIGRPDALSDPRFATSEERRRHRDEANELVASWMREQTLADVESRFARMGVAGAAVRSADGIVGDDHVEARGMLARLTSQTGVPFQAPAAVPRLSRTPAPPPKAAPVLGEHSDVVDAIAASAWPAVGAVRTQRRAHGNGSVLDGFRVVDLSQVLAGPFAAGLLADLGAEVIMIELPGAEPAPPRLSGGAPAGFLSTNRNKKSVTLDVRTPDGKEALFDLVRVSDVLVENFRPGTLERWGIGPEALAEVNPGLVVVRISGFGQSGPYSERSSYNPVACAFGGVTYLGGWPDRAPLRDGITAGDYGTSLFAVYGTLAALVRRDLDGLGQVVDVAMYEGALRITGDTIALKTALGVRQERAGGGWPVYPIALTLGTADGRHVLISAQSWDELGSVAGGLGIDGADGPERVQDGLAAFVSARDTEDALAALRRWGARCSAVQSAADLVGDAHVWARGNLVRVEDPELGAIVIPGVAPSFRTRPGSVAGWSSHRGSDNDEVFGALLGYPPERIERLSRTAAPSAES